METGVIILFNEPTRPHGTAWNESDVGVLFEVEAVAAALNSLGIPHRRVCARTLREVGALLAPCPEGVVVNLVEVLAPSVFDGCLVPAVCEALGKSCTGTGAAAQIVALDKWQAKCALQAGGVPVPGALVVPPNDKPSAVPIGAGRVIVKPLRADASEGIDASSVIEARDMDLVEKAVRRIHEQFQQPALIEEYIDGREINVSLLERRGVLTVLPLAEIDFSAFPPARPRIVDYAAKWIEDSFEYQHTPRRIPADLDEGTSAKVRACALAAWRSIGCRDYARVDIRIDGLGEPHVIEVNPNPDISPDAGFAAALAAAGISTPEFVRTLIENATPSQAGRLADSALGLETRREGQISLRWSIPEDEEAVLRIVQTSGVFRLNEIDVSREVLRDALASGEKGHYQSYTAIWRDAVAGWVCFGPTPCTDGTFDIYWIVVDPCAQRAGVGSALIARAENDVRQRHGRLAVIETSSRAVYTPARRFYVRHGYAEASRIRDFYGVGDDKVVLVKAMPGS